MSVQPCATLCNLKKDRLHSLYPLVQEPQTTFVQPVQPIPFLHTRAHMRVYVYMRRKQVTQVDQVVQDSHTNVDRVINLSVEVAQGCTGGKRP